MVQSKVNPATIEEQKPPHFYGTRTDNHALVWRLLLFDCNRIVAGLEQDCTSVQKGGIFLIFLKIFSHAIFHVIF